jgi:hypothetical protein
VVWPNRGLKYGLRTLKLHPPRSHVPLFAEHSGEIVVGKAHPEVVGAHRVATLMAESRP